MRARKYRFKSLHITSKYYKKQYLESAFEDFNIDFEERLYSADCPVRFGRLLPSEVIQFKSVFCRR